MSILVIGGDNLESIAHKLSENGFTDIQHISGRKPGDRKIKLSCETDLVLVLVDFIGHTLMNNIKKESKKYGVKITFSKRSWTHIENNIQNCIKGI
jgi:hypothetical protein